MTIEKKILNDLNNGLSWAKIMKKHNLKSDCLIRKVRGFKHNYNYLKIGVNIDSIKCIDNKKLTTLTAYLYNINKLVDNKGVCKLLMLLIDESNKRKGTEEQ